MKYYVCTTRKNRKNAKRHILEKCSSMKDAERVAKLVNSKLYRVEIINGNWTVYRHL